MKRETLKDLAMDETVVAFLLAASGVAADAQRGRAIESTRTAFHNAALELAEKLFHEGGPLFA